MAGLPRWPGVPVLLLWACGGVGVTDYRAVPVQGEHDWGDRLHVERGGVRVVVGPAAVFPYDRRGAGGERERGRYQLYTRVVVENTGRDAVEVVWSGAVLEVPGGGRVRLVHAGAASAGPGGVADPAGAGAPPGEPVELLEPGGRAVRALIPETVCEIGVGEPMVPLCDGCEYRMVLVVRVGGREERLAIPFRLAVERTPGGSRGVLWRDREE